MREGFVRKRCLRCGGNIYVERDYYGWNEKCLQCGYASELPSIVEVREKASRTSWKEPNKVRVSGKSK